jgi:hypothetical protein
MSGRSQRSWRGVVLGLDEFDLAIIEHMACRHHVTVSDMKGSSIPEVTIPAANLHASHANFVELEELV